MGGEWSKAVKKIFDKKYSNGRGKLVDAMKDPETKALHQEMLGKKPMNMTKMNNKMSNKMKKTQRYKKTKRGGDEGGEEEEEEGGGSKRGGGTCSMPATPATPATKVGKKSRKSRK